MVSGTSIMSSVGQIECAIWVSGFFLGIPASVMEKLVVWIKQDDTRESALETVGLCTHQRNFYTKGSGEEGTLMILQWQPVSEILRSKLLGLRPQICSLLEIINFNHSSNKFLLSIYYQQKTVKCWEFSGTQSNPLRKFCRAKRTKNKHNTRNIEAFCKDMFFSGAV